MAYIQFYYPKRLSFSPLDYESGLGGTESSIVLVAETLAKKGHYVEVFCACWNPGYYHGVNWRGAWEISNAPVADVLVHVRTESSVIENGASKHLFWMMDDRASGAIAFHKMYPNSVIIVESEAMKKRLNGIENVALIYLPVEYERLGNGRVPSESNYCVHTSMPNRGLLYLLEIWTEVRKQIPNAVLEVTSGWELWGYTKEEARDRMNQLFNGKQPEREGVIFNGVLSKEALFEKIKNARMCLLPSYFPEMFCVSAAEASSAGRPLIVSDYEALAERVADNISGYCIKGDIRDKKTQELFVNRIAELYKNDEKLNALGNSARNMSLKYSPNIVIEQWEKIF